MPIRMRLWLYWTLGAFVMLLSLAALSTFLSVVVSAWLHLFARRPVDGAGLGLRIGLVFGAMLAVGGLMEVRRRFAPEPHGRDPA